MAKSHTAALSHASGEFNIFLLSDKLWQSHTRLHCCMHQVRYHTTALLHASGEFNIAVVGQVVAKSHTATLLHASGEFNIAVFK